MTGDLSDFTRRRPSSHAWRAWPLLALVLIALVISRPALRAQPAGQDRLDPTFSDDGQATVDLGGAGLEEARAVIVQPDGKILVGGAVSIENIRSFGLARFDSDGTLDESFGAGGTAIATFEGPGDLEALFLDPDGKIVAAGQALIPGGLTEVHFAVARFTTAGTLDPDFGTGGMTTSSLGVIPPPPFGGGPSIAAVTRQPDGKFLAAGKESFTGATSEVLLARYEAAGAPLDPTFGEAGRVRTDVAGAEDAATTVLFQRDDGKIVVAGTAVVAGSGNIALVRYDTHGDLDPEFGDGGIVTTDVLGTDRADAAVLRPDGTIIVAGMTGAAQSVTGIDLCLVRYRPNGDRDPDFGDDGKVTTDIAGGTDRAFAIAVQADDRVVVAGSSTLPGAEYEDFALARYNTDGSLDADFGNGGTLVTDFEQRADAALALALQPDGKIVAAGHADIGGQQDLAVARYLPGGQADVAIAKSVSAPVITTGATFTYTLTVTNHGPDDATQVVVADTLPAGTTFVACDTSADGVCAGEGNTRSIAYAAIPPGGTRTITLAATLDAAVPDGTSLSNLATVAALATDAFDPDPANNRATATIVARAVPHTLRLYLHGTDVPGTAGGFTMTLAPAPAQPLTLNLLNAPTWFSDPPLTGTLGAGATFRLVRPCTLGLGVLLRYRLAKVDPNGGAEQALGETQRLLAPCLGQEVVSIPVTTPVTFANERLRLTMSSTVGLNLDLQLGEGAFLEATNFTGVP